MTCGCPRALGDRKQDARDHQQDGADEHEGRRDHQQAHLGEQPQTQSREQERRPDGTEQSRDDAFEAGVREDVDDRQYFIHGIASVHRRTRYHLWLKKPPEAPYLEGLMWPLGRPTDTMASKSGKTGSAGRFGARYGRVARRRVAEIEAETNADHTCPNCGEDRVDRRGTGIWQCNYCDYKYTGGSYEPETPGGKTVRRSIRAALAEDEE